ncbi:hypothetical protein M878_11435 [Streptomyces roseochromogenus subsp. oscitans DS 12.976]|uniref:Uncharacterized protein n=1 Tax=Streptomyces roseochromogenus subsp. oscitans DS 12.976 TaxID=1352936 RepID=V6KPV1_STRRC|nr:hypothetical protein M878_11435 [Streptomyces roseochromogenus subsp. oscitans DS 12.976]
MRLTVFWQWKTRRLAEIFALWPSGPRRMGHVVGPRGGVGVAVAIVR